MRFAEHSRSDFVCPVMSGKRLVQRTVAPRAERSRSDFVCPQMSGRLVQRDRGAQGRAFEVGLCLSGRCLYVMEYCLHRGWDSFGAVLCQRRAKVAGNFVKRSNELSEQSEERLAAQRKRAAVKVSNECSKDREERLRAKREREAAEQAQTTSLSSLRGKPASSISLSRS